VLALAVLAGVTVVRFGVWAAVDEAAHYDYLLTVAEDHRLPLIGDSNHEVTREISFRTYPRPSGRDPAALGLAGHSYEAFQPPLYYLLAAPAFMLRSDHLQKVKAVRAFDALLLLLAAGAVWWLAGLVAPQRRELAAAAGLSVLLWPGVVVRAVTISPTALELVLAIVLLGVLWRIHAGAGRRWMAAAGALLAACLLTKATLVYLVPLAAFVLVRRRDARGLALATAIGLLLIAPWLAFNHHHYGSLTADRQARAQQRPLVNPTGRHYGASDVAHFTRRLLDNVLPTEWRKQLDVGWVQVAVLLLDALLLGGWLLVARRGPPAWFFIAPVIAGYVVMVVVLLGEQWPSFNLRYLYAVLPGLAIGVVAAAPERQARWGVVASLALVAALWVDMFGAFYFTGVGHALGI
jgi:4-amino-4-deoxy-L-arabinose transferase-like glycosyltransferase